MDDSTLWIERRHNCNKSHYVEVTTHLESGEAEKEAFTNTSASMVFRETTV